MGVIRKIWKLFFLR